MSLNSSRISCFCTACAERVKDGFGITEAIEPSQMISMLKIFGLKEKLDWAQSLRAVDVLVSTSLGDLVSDFKFEAMFAGLGSEKSVSDMLPTPSFNKPANVFLNSMAQENDPIDGFEHSRSGHNDREIRENRLDTKPEDPSLGKLEFFSFNLLVKHLFKFDFNGESVNSSKGKFLASYGTQQRTRFCGFGSGAAVFKIRDQVQRKRVFAE